MIVNIKPSPPMIFGAGASWRTGMVARGLGIRKALCIYDQGMKDTGIAGRIVENLKAAGIQVVCYEGVQPDPPDYIIHEAATFANEENIDGIIGVGGGSVMDAAKAVNILTTNPFPITKYFDLGVVQKPGKVLILIPTTAGTGSEVTEFAIVTDTLNNKKVATLGPPTIANQAIIDPELLLGMPASLTAACGMDAFAHAAEALTSSGMNPLSDALAQKAISLIVDNLPAAVKDNNDITALTNMSFAATIAGTAFNSTVTHIGHAMAHTIGAFYHIPHGVGCALALPAVMEFVADTVPEKVRQIGAAMGLSLDKGMAHAELGLAVADAIREFLRKIGIPTLEELSVQREMMALLVPAVMSDMSSYFSPKWGSAEQVYYLMDNMYKY